MSKQDEKTKRLNRRKLLKSSAAASIAGVAGGGSVLESLLGTVRAESATDDDVKRIAQAPGVQSILAELGISQLPSPDEVEKRRILDDGTATQGELVVMKVDLKYGRLLAVDRNGDIGTVFAFDRDLPSVPSDYSMVTETGGTLANVGTGLEFSRGATDAEEEQVLSTLDVEGKIERTRVQATTSLGGFRVELAVRNPETDEIETPEYLASTTGEFTPKENELLDISSVSPLASLQTSQQLSGGGTVTTQGIGFDIIKGTLEGWLESTVFSIGLDKAGVVCDETCTNCALWIYDVLTTCETCLDFCVASETGVGAILCVVCFYR